MRKTIVRTIAILAALSVSGLAVALAWAGSMQRASVQHDQLLLAGVSVSAVLAVHLLPVLLGRRHPIVLRSVWLGCRVERASHLRRQLISQQAGESAAQIRTPGMPGRFVFWRRSCVSGCACCCFFLAWYAGARCADRSAHSPLTHAQALLHADLHETCQ